MNRLKREKSPYLLQHADNPVDWYPWGDEAFERARATDRLVLVSIGYSTCHWCHVMSGDCFEDREVADVMNRNLVPIKVDREERPDVDREYMEVCLKLNGRGGWPLNVFLTPSGRPFYATTYLPGRGREGQMGMMELVSRLSTLWKEDRPVIERLADSLAVGDPNAEGASLPMEEGEISQAVFRARDHLEEHFDRQNGGFYGKPKFPMAHCLRFFMSSAVLADRPDLIHCVELTLERIRAGGIGDLLGGGFHRYAVDRQWRLPHFEKMLYDQAMLALAFLEGWQLTGRTFMAETCRETLNYVLRDLRSPEEAFYSAEDADSDEGEGHFYTWSWQELKEKLTDGELELARDLWGVRPGGNYVPEGGQPGGRNLLLREGSGSFAAEEEALREKLRRVRQKRVRPGRDEKILTDWNGLMIAALARCGASLDEPDYVEAAGRAAGFLMGGAGRPDGGLWHRCARGEWGIEGFLDDSAFLVWGLLELYQATFERKWLDRAFDLTEDCLDRFGCASSGALSFSEGKDLRLHMKGPSGEDGPYPSGNGVMARNLLHLGGLSGNAVYFERAGEIMRAFSHLLAAAPWGAVTLVDAWQLYRAGLVRVELTGVDGKGRHPFLASLRAGYAPRRVLLARAAGEEEGEGDRAVPGGRAFCGRKAVPFTEEMAPFLQKLALLEERG